MFSAQQNSTVEGTRVHPVKQNQYSDVEVLLQLLATVIPGYRYVVPAKPIVHLTKQDIKKLSGGKP
jgi:hypothetical protein